MSRLKKGILTYLMECILESLYDRNFNEIPISSSVISGYHSPVMHKNLLYINPGKNRRELLRISLSGFRIIFSRYITGKYTMER